MLDDLSAAVDAYRAAQAAVDEAEHALAGVKAEVPQARERLYAAIVAAGREGIRQSDIIRVTGYNRETVRRILRAGGVQADD